MSDQNEPTQGGALPSVPLQPVVLPPVLDACCGGRMFWFDHADKRALFCDRRRAFREVDIGTPGTKGRKPLVVEPDMIADFTAMPFPSDSFALVVFDPPHLEKLGATGKYATSYGRLEGDWQGMAAYWKKYYNTPAGAGTVEGFLKKARPAFDL